MKHATLLPQDEALLRRTITAGLSDDEHAVFVRTATDRGSIHSHGKSTFRGGGTKPSSSPLSTGSG